MFIVLLSVLCITILIQADLPPEINKCHAAELDCLANTINDVIRRYPKGNSAFGLTAIDDIVLTDLVISETKENSPITLNLKFKKVHIYGFDKLNITRVVGFEKNPKKSKFELYGFIPLVTLKGSYVMNGKILLLPMTGDGEAEYKLTNLKLGLKVKVDVAVKNGKQYVEISKIKSSLEVELIQVQMDNMFNGNKELSDSVLKIINESWKDIWLELKDGISNAVSYFTKSVTNTVFKELAYDDFYKTDD